MRLLVTGGAGFIGSEFLRVALESGHEPTCYDALTYAGDRRNVPKEVSFYAGRIEDAERLASVLDAVRPHAVISLAAESHVDNSIGDAHPFIMTNVLGVQILIDACLKRGIRLVQVSTDEVYGPLVPGVFGTPEFTLKPGNGYSASKAGGDMLVLAAVNTHGLDGVVTRCVNNFGPRQHPEKFIPKAITRVLAEQKVPVFARGEQIRDWIHTRDHAGGILCALKSGLAGRIYHIASNNEQRNIDIVRRLLWLLGKDESWIEFVADRPGHDFRYGLNCIPLRELGWGPRPQVFEHQLAETVEWYKQNREWWGSKVR